MSRAAALPLAFALAAALALPSAAESRRLAAAWDAAGGEVEGVIGAADLATINIIAYHGAVARLCEGFELDTDEIAAATNALLAAAPADLDPEALLARQSELLLAVGTAHGLFLAEGSLHPQAFCAEAETARADAEHDNHWR